MDALETIGVLIALVVMAVFGVVSCFVKRPDYREFNGDSGDPET